MCETLRLTISPTTNSLGGKQCNKIQISLKASISTPEQQNSKSLHSFLSHEATGVNLALGSGSECGIMNLTNGTYQSEKFRTYETA
jgi:hypothetical protein